MSSVQNNRIAELRAKIRKGLTTDWCHTTEPLTDAECDALLLAEFLRIAERLETLAGSPMGNAETERVLRYEAEKIRKEVDNA